MFEQTFVDGVGKTKRPLTILLSFAIQIVAIGILVIIPLIYYDALPGAQLSSFWISCQTVLKIAARIRARRAGHD